MTLHADGAGRRYNRNFKLQARARDQTGIAEAKRFKTSGRAPCEDYSGLFLRLSWRSARTSTRVISLSARSDREDGP